MLALLAAIARAEEVYVMSGTADAGVHALPRPNTSSV